jgi:hypothetical protein
VRPDAAPCVEYDEQDMARGFESKDVEFQQAEAERRHTARRALTADERAAAQRRRTLELALASAKSDLATARTGPHREMLVEAIASLEQQLSGPVP